jgi:hypothetical protein
MQMTKARRITSFAGFAGTGAILLGLLMHKPAQAGDVVDGIFAHDCCGTLALQSGRMVINNKQAIAYTIARDETGPYITPVTYVGPWEDRGFEVDGTRPAVKMRLDRLPKPTSLVLVAGRSTYIFKRENPPPQRRFASKS